MSFNNSTDFQENYFPVNRLYTVLTQDIDQSTTVINVEDTTGFPPKGWVSIDEEIIFYDYLTNNSFGDSTHPVTRGTDGTTASSHSSGSRASQRINAAVFHEIMKSVKKRREYILTSDEVAAGSISTQNIPNFASRVRTGDTRIIPMGTSQDFYVEFYRHSTFRGEDRIYKTLTLAVVQSPLSQDCNTGDTAIYINDVSNFSVDELIVIGDFPAGTYEYALIKEIDATNNKITLFDDLLNGYTANKEVTKVYQEEEPLYYEDLDWLGQLHTRIVNNDMSGSVTVHFHWIAETSDEA